MSKPLRVFHLICKKPYPKLGEKLVLRDFCEEGYDFKRANWGTNFSQEFEDISDTIKKRDAFQENYYPEALVLT